MARPRMLVAALCALALTTAAAPATADAGKRRQMVRAINFVRGWSHIHGVGYSAPPVARRNLVGALPDAPRRARPQRRRDAPP